MSFTTPTFMFDPLPISVSDKIPSKFVLSCHFIEMINVNVFLTPPLQMEHDKYPAQNDFIPGEALTK